MKVGIDQIGYFTPNKYVDMVDLAHARNQDQINFNWNWAKKNERG